MGASNRAVVPSGWPLQYSVLYVQEDVKDV